MKLIAKQRRAADRTAAAFGFCPRTARVPNLRTTNALQMMVSLPNSGSVSDRNVGQRTLCTSSGALWFGALGTAARGVGSQSKPKRGLQTVLQKSDAICDCSDGTSAIQFGCRCQRPFGWQPERQPKGNSLQQSSGTVNQSRASVCFGIVVGCFQCQFHCR